MGGIGLSLANPSHPYTTFCNFYFPHHHYRFMPY